MLFPNQFLGQGFSLVDDFTRALIERAKKIAIASSSHFSLLEYEKVLFIFVTLTRNTNLMNSDKKHPLFYT